MTVAEFEKLPDDALNAEDLIDAPALLPGFSIPVRALFE
jgi:hypothetical protein